MLIFLACHAGAPFVFGAFLMLIALIVATTVDRAKADTTVQHTAAAEADLHEPLLAGGESKP